MAGRKPLPDCFRHYDRVLVGADQAPGRLLRCKKRDGQGEYWKVHADSGDWRWADTIILAGPGAKVAVCERGGGKFKTNEQGDGLLCPRHEEEIFGTRRRALEAPSTYHTDREDGRWRQVRNRKS